jgi:ketosteroid isomerase-like protein
MPTPPGCRRRGANGASLRSGFLDARDCVLAFARLVAVGHESGVPIELETNHIWTVRDGRATSMCVYRDRAEALEALERSDYGTSSP